MKTIDKNFLWGVATSSYQIEGAAKEGGRSESIWDNFCKIPGKIANNDNGDIACDHYHKYKDDVSLMKNLGVKAYRFSVSWPRIIPEGVGESNQEGIQFYIDLIDELLKNDIEPWATLYHWDLPHVLQEKGGWQNRDIVKWFEAYADVVVNAFKGRVKNFIILNEPSVVAYQGHFDGTHAPGIMSKDATLKATHHQNLVIGNTFSFIKEHWPDLNVGSSYTLFPVYSIGKTEEDIRARETIDALWNKNFFDPLFLKKYPDIFEREFEEIMQDGDLDIIAQPLDFIGVQHYAPMYVKGCDNEIEATLVAPPENSPVTDMGWPYSPEAFHECLVGMKENYKNPKIYITENGAAYKDKISEDGLIHDADRVRYYKEYLSQVMRAMKDGVNIRGYFAWSFLDNFEWAWGYDKRFGLVYVDFETQERVPKDAYYWYKDFITKINETN